MKVFLIWILSIMIASSFCISVHFNVIAAFFTGMLTFLMLLKITDET